MFFDIVEEVWHHTGHNVVARRNGLGPRLLDEPAVLNEVAGGKSVDGAAQPLRPERLAEPPWLCPVCVRRPEGRPAEDEQRSETAQQAPW